MKNWDRQKLYLGWLWLLLLLLPAVGSAALAPAATYPGALRIVGPLQLELKVTPPIGTPGDTLVLELSLVNLDQVTYQPEVSLQLPLGLRLNVANLPPGATVNLQANRLTWVPVVSANGGTQQFALPLRVETADILRPEQTITAVLKFNNQVQEAATTLWIGIPPYVSSVNLPGQVSLGLPIQLRAELNGPGPISQSWQLGDGRRVDVNDPVVVYPAAGVYDVTLTASNAIGAATAVRRITIVPHPTAQFKVEDDTPGVGQPVRFVNESGGQTPITYRWDFGDGATSADAQPAHVYTSPGVYQVRLSIENAFGRSEALWPLTVGLPPAADMALDEFASSGQPVRALGLGDDTVTAFRWDMGDGRTHEGAQISHIYALPGNYYITMTASNQFGDAQVSRWLAVEPGIMAVYLPAIMTLDSEAIVPGASLDPLGVVLEPVDLEAPFVMAPLDLPATTSPAEQLFVYINEARRQFDLPPLQYVYELTVAAQQHAEDMVAYRYTGHTGSDGSTPAERLLWHGYSRAYAGEATAWGFEQAYQAVEFWVNSPGHRAIILNKYATEVGVAFTANFSAPMSGIGRPNLARMARPKRPRCGCAGRCLVRRH
ncbi:MAG: PKD domain-containing protein [Chloroflexi bacterium]|nr:PKD domain-containing protein [Chloroflexota bacterium]